LQFCFMEFAFTVSAKDTIPWDGFWPTLTPVSGTSRTVYSPSPPPASSVSKKILSSSLLTPALTVAALALGIPIGRSLQHPLRIADSKQEAGNSGNRLHGSAATGNALKGTNLTDDEAAAEAEFARLLGETTRTESKRTPLQIMAGISAAFQQRSELRRFLGIYEAVSELEKDTMGEALERAKAESNPIAVRAIERRWAEIDPEGALKDWTEGKGKPPGDAFFGAWAKSNPAGALRWFSALPEGELRREASVAVLDRIAKADPQRALDFANQLSDGKDQSLLVTRALAALGGKDPTTALAAAQSLPEGPGRKIGLDSVVTQVATTNLEEAQRLAKELPPNTLSGAGSVIAGALVRQSPESALEWAATLPEGTTKASAYAGIAREWAGRDVTAAASWLDGLSKGPERDSAVASFANRTAPRDPEGATAWASTLSPGEQRTAVLSQTIAIWQRINPAAAAEWLANATELTASEREAIAQAASQRFAPQRSDPQRLRQFRERRDGQ
jgi:hypothetical protein